MSTWPEDESVYVRAANALTELLGPRRSPDGHPCAACGTSRSTSWKRVDRLPDGTRDYICDTCRARPC